MHVLIVCLYQKWKQVWSKKDETQNEPLVLGAAGPQSGSRGEALVGDQEVKP